MFGKQMIDESKWSEILSVILHFFWLQRETVLLYRLVYKRQNTQIYNDFFFDYPKNGIFFTN